MRRRATTLPILAAVVLALGMVAATPALAQNDPITGFFRMIFGGGQPPPPQVIPEAPKKPKPPAEPKIVEIPKNPDAQIVLVIGDVEAQGLAVGLQMAFADEPSIVVVPKTRALATLTRDGDGDWLQSSAKLLAETRADFVVAMIGVNDMAPVTVPGVPRPTDPLAQKALEPGGDDWNRIYGERLDRHLAAIRATGKPFWWVGLPPTADADRKPTARAAYAAFLSGLNDLVRPKVQAAGGSFVDVWTAFTDEEGRYTPTGPDVDGQVKRLRAWDGVLFTRAGQRKLAFFVEEEIRKVMRGDTPSNPTTPEEPIAQPKPEEAIVAGPPPLPPAPWNVVGPVLSLGDAPADAGTTLAGGPDRRPRAELPGGYPVVATPAWRRLVEGLPIDPVPGRVDDVVRRVP